MLHFLRDGREVCVWAFDLLYLDAKDLRGLPLVERKALLARLVHRAADNRLLLSETLGHNYMTIRLFCEPLSLCPRTHSFRCDDQDMVVFCFAQRDHAERFRARFGGDFIDPKDRPKWPGSQ